LSSAATGFADPDDLLELGTLPELDTAAEEPELLAGASDVAAELDVPVPAALVAPDADPLLAVLEHPASSATAAATPTTAVAFICPLRMIKDFLS